MLGTVFTTIAGSHQPSDVGTRNDMDYWLTIQGTIISLVNVLVLIFTTVQKSHMPIES